MCEHGHMGQSIAIQGLISGDRVTAYRAEPEGELKGALIVIHEIWGLVDHIKDVADRFAAQGYLVVAPDILSGIGVVPEVGNELFEIQAHGTDEQRIEAQPRMRDAFASSRSPEFGEKSIAALKQVVEYLESQPGIDGRIAVTGFCFGGSYAFLLASADSRIRAAVPWYGQAPEPVQLGSISCPVLAIYGGLDERLMDALPEVTTSMADAGVDFTAKVYPEARHAFFNDTSRAAYDPDAAADAWPLVLRFLDTALNPAQS
jgi:carboxymethylenebutenolidase